MQVKGLEAPYHDPRAITSLAVAYATSNRGACHRGVTHTLERNGLAGLGYPKPMDRLAQEGKGKLAAIAQNYAELANSLKILFPGDAGIGCSVVGYMDELCNRLGHGRGRNFSGPGKEAST